MGSAKSTAALDALAQGKFPPCLRNSGLDTWRKTKREFFPKHLVRYQQQIPTMKSHIIIVFIPLMLSLYSIEEQYTLKTRKILDYIQGEVYTL